MPELLGRVTDPDGAPVEDVDVTVRPSVNSSFRQVTSAGNGERSSPLLVLAPPFLGPGFRLGARWNRLGEAVKTRKKRGKTGQKWARYGLKRVNKEGTGGITWTLPIPLCRPA